MASSGPDLLLPPLALPEELVRNLVRQNPWWGGGSLPQLPAYRRWPFGKLIARLDQPVAPINVVRGPRQIGKTTLQLQIVDALLKRGVTPTRIFRVQFDDLPTLKDRRLQEPILRLVEWFESSVLKSTLNASAQKSEPAYLFLDEVQNLGDWDVQLKSLVDHATVRVLVTGSSALRIERGRDSLAGRIHSMEVGPFRLAEIGQLRGFGAVKPFQEDNGEADWLRADFWRQLVAHANAQLPGLTEAFAAFSRLGGYPLAQNNPNLPWSDVADQLRETVVKRVIEHDLRIGDRGRKRDAALLEEIFRIACRYLGQAPNPTFLAREAQLTLHANVGVQRVRHYLDFLDSSLLLKQIEPLEIRLKKRRGYRKICLCDHAIRAAWLQEVIPLDPVELDRNPHLMDLAGRVAESTAGYYLSSITGLAVSHLPERGGDPEVDYVLTIGERRIPVEIKYRRQIDSMRDTLGLRAFIEKAANNAPFGLLITREDAQAPADPRIITIPLRALLIVR
jgi:hypothetical protein